MGIQAVLCGTGIWVPRDLSKPYLGGLMSQRGLSQAYLSHGMDRGPQQHRPTWCPKTMWVQPHSAGIRTGYQWSEGLSEKSSKDLAAAPSPCRTPHPPCKQLLARCAIGKEERGDLSKERKMTPSGRLNFQITTWSHPELMRSNSRFHNQQNWGWGQLWKIKLHILHNKFKDHMQLAYSS